MSSKIRIKADSASTEMGAVIVDAPKKLIDQLRAALENAGHPAPEAQPAARRGFLGGTRQSLTVKLDDLTLVRAYGKDKTLSEALSKSSLNDVSGAADKAVHDLITEKLKVLYDQYPDVRFKKGEDSKFGSAVDLQIQNISISCDHVVFRMRAPKNGFYSTDPDEYARKFFGELGFNRFNDDHSLTGGYTKRLAPEEYWHTEGPMFTIEYCQKKLDSFSISVDKAALLENLGIKAQAEEAQKDAIRSATQSARC